jgi:hypothetical protein
MRFPSSLAPLEKSVQRIQSRLFAATDISGMHKIRQKQEFGRVIACRRISLHFQKVIEKGAARW